MAVTVVTIVESGSRDYSQGCVLMLLLMLMPESQVPCYSVGHHPMLRVTIFNDSKVLCIHQSSSPARRAVGVGAFLLQ